MSNPQVNATHVDVTELLPPAAAPASHDIGGASFADALEAATVRPVPKPVRIEGDLDNDGVINDAERLALAIKQLIEHLILMMAYCRGKRANMNYAMDAVKQLEGIYNDLTKRIVEGEEVTKNDLDEIVAQVVDLFSQACAALEGDKPDGSRGRDEKPRFFSAG
jgi:hypothetical protein